MKRIAPLLIILLLLSSCRYGARINPSEYAGDTWASVFEAFWHGMNDNYLFWDLDSPGSEWDAAYDEYMPRFEALGKTGSRAEEAFRLFFDLTDGLSDGHFILRLSDPLADKHIQISDYTRSILEDAGVPDDRQFSLMMTNKNFEPLTDLESVTEYSNSEAACENTFSIIEHDFGRSVPSEPGDLYSDSPSGQYGSEFDSLRILVHSYPIGKDDSLQYAMVLGRTKDGIVYLSLSEFFIYYYLRYSTLLDEDDLVQLERMLGMVSDFNQMIVDESTTGIIVDLRGNTGGVNSDLPFLLSRFSSKPVNYMLERTKRSDNRLDYTGWVPITMTPDGSGRFIDPDIPIAVLINSGTFSNGEISTLFFKALQDSGRNVSIIGTASGGGLGSNISNEYFNAGQFSISPNIVLVRTPSVEHAYIDGTVVEDVGIIPDAIETGVISSSGDPKLEKAFHYIRTFTE